MKKKENNPIKDIWNCYSPYVKGKREDIERLFNDNVISPELISNKVEDNEIVSFKILGNRELFGGYSVYVDAKLITGIIANYPNLIVTCIFTGDLISEVDVAVVISENGYPFVTRGEIIGNDASDDSYTMDEFEDLFKDYYKEVIWEDPHSGSECELTVDYSYPFWNEWDNNNLLTN